MLQVKVQTHLKQEGRKNEVSNLITFIFIFCLREIFEPKRQDPDEDDLVQKHLITRTTGAHCARNHAQEPHHHTLLGPTHGATHGMKTT